MHDGQLDGATLWDHRAALRLLRFHKSWLRRLRISNHSWHEVRVADYRLRFGRLLKKDVGDRYQTGLLERGPIRPAVVGHGLPFVPEVSVLRDRKQLKSTIPVSASGWGGDKAPSA